MDATNPCLTCGACCAYFRVSFYWTEADDWMGGTVPVNMTSQVSPLFRVMQGTNQPQPRCIALQGTVGSNVRCSIYAQRPSSCYEFVTSGKNGITNDLCDRARMGWGLRPLVTDMTDKTGQVPYGNIRQANLIFLNKYGKRTRKSLQK